MGFFDFLTGKRYKQIVEYLEQAGAAVRREQYDEAIAIYQQLLKMGYRDAIGLIGDVYREMGDTQKMMEMYEKGTRCTVSEMSAAAVRGYAESFIYGIGHEQDFKKVEYYLRYAEKAENNLIDKNERNNAARKRAALDREYWEERKRYRKWQEEQKQLEDEARGLGAVRRAVEAAPQSLIKGLHPFRMSGFTVYSSHIMSSNVYKIAKEDVAVTVNTALKADQLFQEGFVFTNYGVASHYFTAARNMIGKSNFWEQCELTVPYYNLIEVEQDGKYVHCRYTDREEIIVLAGDHAAWLCRIFQNLIDTGYTKLPCISPFMELTGKP